MIQSILPLLMQLQAFFDCGGNASWGTTRRRDLGGSSLESPHCCRKKTMLRLHIIVCGLIFSGLVFETAEYARYAYQGTYNEGSNLLDHRGCDARVIE